MCSEVDRGLFVNSKYEGGCTQADVQSIAHYYWYKVEETQPQRLRLILL
jgi:hypothetical protein